MKDFINEKLVATTSEEIFADQVLIGFLHLDKIAMKQVLNEDKFHSGCCLLPILWYF